MAESQAWWERHGPRLPSHGIKAHTRRGAFGQSWWASRWVAALEQLVNPAVQREFPAAVDDGTIDPHLKARRRVRLRGPLAQLVAPVGAELRPPNPRHAVAAFARAEVEFGEFTDAEKHRPAIEIQPHDD